MRLGRPVWPVVVARSRPVGAARGRAAVASGGLRRSRRGYYRIMTNESPLPASDDADPEKESTPAGVAGDLEKEATEAGATTDED
jgi:hypothetical protein